MQALTCYRLTIGNGPDTFESFLLNAQAHQIQTLIGERFEARLYVPQTKPRISPWAVFLQASFPGTEIANVLAPSALLLVKLTEKGTATSKSHGVYFAFPFGHAGRFLIRSERILRGYGLRTALNLIYPKNSGNASARLRSVDSKRHGLAVIRARTQASSQVNLEEFDVNPLRDLLDRATGTPAKNEWGQTISGSDAFSFSRELEIQDIGKICRKLDQAYNKSDYKDGFSWIDKVRSVSESEVNRRLEAYVVELLQANSAGLNLAPPEMLDWSRNSGFEYQPDADDSNRAPVSDLLLSDYLDVLGQKKIEALSADYLRRARIAAVDSDGAQTKWSTWRCLVGEFQYEKKHYLLDEGRFFTVEKSYLSALDKFVNDLDDDLKPDAATRLVLPETEHDTPEGSYNDDTALTHDHLLRLDRRTLGIPGGRTTIEICDLLSASRQLIHVKRHLGSATLSHLFAQGLVSAELLQTNPEFRGRVADKVAQHVKDDGKKDDFSFFAGNTFTPSDFEIIYAIAEDWNGKKLAERLPFFSRINLREAATNLQSRGFKVSVKQIHAKAPPVAVPTDSP